MPYAQIKQGFEVGNYEIWPYYEESNKRIQSLDAITHLNKHFGRYFERKYHKTRGGYDEILNERYIISPKSFNIGTDTFSDEQIEQIRNVTHIIAFCAISENAFLSSTTDAFTLHIQNFKVGSDGIALWNKYFTKLDMVKFLKPYHLDVSPVPFKKTDLCYALGKAIEHKNKVSIKRIFRTLGLFYHTATRGEFVTNEHRLLSLLMCFEVLLNYKDKYNFAAIVDKLENSPKRILEMRTVKRRGKNENITLSKTGWWAYDLYNLRSAVVHGNNYDWDTEKYGGIFTRIEFGSILLRKFIKDMLLHESILTQNFSDLVFEAGSLDEQLPDTESIP